MIQTLTLRSAKQPSPASPQPPPAASLTTRSSAAVADAGFAVAATADGGLLTAKGCFLKFPVAAARALGHE